MTKGEQLQHLYDLIAVAKDSELGYRTAAEHVDDTHLSGIFEGYATERATFVEDLTVEAARMTGDVPGEHGSVAGAMFRGWMNLKSALTGGSPGAIVAACETGEDSALAAYEKVVNAGMTGKPRSVVEAQWNKIKQAHQRMLHLKQQLVTS